MADGVPIRFADIQSEETISFDLSECQGAAVCLSLNGTSLAKPRARSSHMETPTPRGFCGAGRKRAKR